ncbi:MAG: hypothetical protein KAS94_14485 [Desulfobulbaceae bacterium]|nr:hypothetical protein [Desulfobulbaceae bacterium]
MMNPTVFSKLGLLKVQFSVRREEKEADLLLASVDREASLEIRHNHDNFKKYLAVQNADDL